MKKITLLFISIIVCFSGCKKDSTTVIYEYTPPAPGYTMTLTETALTGKWMWDKTEDWFQGHINFQYDSLSNPELSGAYMDLKNTLFHDSLSTPQKFEAYATNDSTGPYLNSWSVNYTPTDTALNTFTPPYTNGGYIEFISSSSLIITTWHRGALKNGVRQFYHK